MELKILNTDKRNMMLSSTNYMRHPQIENL